MNFLTQSAVVDFLAKNVSKLGNVVDKTVGEMLLGCKPVVKVNINHNAIDAFKLMAEHKVSAVAVVDDENHLISNLSARDIRVSTKFQRPSHLTYIIISRRLPPITESFLGCLLPSGTFCRLFMLSA